MTFVMMVILKDENTLAQNLELIRQALGESYCIISNGAIGNDLGYLCNSKKIIWWSKNKPINRDSVVRITEEQRRNSSYGIIAESVNILNDESKHQVLTRAINNDFGWSYDRPIGKDDSQYRLWDFNGYQENAVNPLYFNVLGENSGDVEIKFASGELQRDVNFEIGAYGDNILPEGNITLSDLTAMIGDQSDLGDKGYEDKGYMLLYREEGSDTTSDTGIDDENGDIKYPLVSVDEFGNKVMKAVIPIKMKVNKTYLIAGVLLNTQSANNYLFPMRAIKVVTSKATEDATVVLVSSGAEDFDYVAKFNITSTFNAVSNITVSAYLKRYGSGENILDTYEFNVIDIPTQNIDLGSSSIITCTLYDLKEILKSYTTDTFVVDIDIIINKGSVGIVNYNFTEDVTNIFD